MQMSAFMRVALGDCQFAGRSRWNRLRANRMASPFQGEGEGLPRPPETPHLNPLPLPKGRGEKGRRFSFNFSKPTISERCHS
jgi:hypothetical protein